jgi:hypothetical protein
MQDHQFNIQSSKILFSVVIFLFSLTVLLILNLSVQGWVKIVFLFFLALYGFCIQLTPIQRLRRLSDGRWLLLIDLQEYKASLRSDSTLTTYVSVLRFTVENKRWPASCVLFPDSFLGDHYRKLVTLLRLA